MKLGIIGKPQSGKTTVFNAACQMQVAVGDYSQAVHRSIIKVPDKRVIALAELVNPKKLTYAEMEILDAPGFSGKGKEAAGIEISEDLKKMEALMAVIDGFSPDCKPEKDIQDLIDEMIIHDQTVVESNITKKEKKMKQAGDKTVITEINLLKRCLAQLETERPLIELDLSDDELKLIRGYMFMSLKPMLIVLNISEDDIPKSEEIYAGLSKFVSDSKRELAVMCGKIEMELVGLEEEELKEFLKDLGITTSAVDIVIQKAYKLLGLMSFLTAGEPEVRAWTIKRGTNAQKAAGVIHSDIERGFIRAEVTSYDDYIEHKTPAALKAAGKQRLEGKEYRVKDGDVILFRFNV